MLLLVLLSLESCILGGSELWSRKNTLEENRVPKHNDGVSAHFLHGTTYEVIDAKEMHLLQLLQEAETSKIKALHPVNSLAESEA